MLYPDDVDNIISTAAPGITSPEPAKALWTQRIAKFTSDVEDGTDRHCHATVNRWFPNEHPEDDPVRAEALKHVKTCSLQGYKILADTIRDYDYAEEVRGLGIRDVRVLVVAGSEDSAVSPGLLRDVASRIAGARFEKMEGAVHLPQLQRGEEFGGIMMGFLEGDGERERW